MKTKINLIILALATVALGACKKQDCCAVGPQADYLALFKGQTEWKATTTEVNTYQDSTYFFGHVGEEHLSMHIKFKGTGKYVLTGNQVSYMVTVGQDVVTVEYQLDPTAESVLNIESYDANKKTYSGNFTLNMLRNYHYDQFDAYYPKKLAFTKGTFKITLAK